MNTKRLIHVSAAVWLGAVLLGALAAWLAGCKPRATDRAPAPAPAPTAAPAAATTPAPKTPDKAAKEDRPMSEKVVKSEEEWRAILTPEQFRVTRRKGTEPAFSGEYNHFKKQGAFNCVCCGATLFRSDAKYDSGSGWPSFWKPADDQSVATEEDASLLPARTEVLCARCGAHLGHVFGDGPQPTGLRYCVNSVALKFAEDAEE